MEKKRQKCRLNRSNPELSSSIDYNYWNERGWTDVKTSYYIDIEIGLLKKIFQEYYTLY